MTLPDFLRRWFRSHPEAAEHKPVECWWQGTAACAICNHSWQAVMEIEPGQVEPIVPLECPECGNITGHPE